MNHYYKPIRWAFLFSGIALAIPFVNAQTDEDEEVFELNPFYVEGDEDQGYTATATLAGTRVRTDLRDLATPITAITAQFLEDTGSTDNKDLLLYTTNTEVGGLYGNWGGFGNTQGISDRDELMQPSNNTRVRGLAQADNTRNYFLSDVPWDSYNVDRVEIQRGPNSILFGQGSPAGLINTATISANFKGNAGKVSNEIAEFGTHRWTMDYNIEAIPDVLAIRVAALYDYEQFQQEPAFNKDNRWYATGTLRQQILPESWAGKTEFRATVETGAITANNPRILPPEDGISLWFEDAAGDGVNDLIGLGMGIWDPFLWNSAGGGGPDRSGNPEVLNPEYIPGANNIDGGPLNNGGVAFFWMNGSEAPYFVSRQAPRIFPGGLGVVDGQVIVDKGIDFPYGSLLRAGSFNNYALALNRMDENNGIGNQMDRRYPFADRGYWKDKSLTDPTIWDFYNYLIDGDNKREYASWDTTNLSLAQTFFKDRLGVEMVYDYQDYSDRRGGTAWNRPYISIDINKNLQSQLPTYSRVPNPDGEGDPVVDRSTYSLWGFTPTADQPYPNPNAGAAISAGSFSNNELRNTERKNYRYTAFLELRGSDVFDEQSWLAQIIGRHVITGLYNEEEINSFRSSYVPAAASAEWAYSLTDAARADSKLSESFRSLVPIIYLSEPLIGTGITSAHGLNLPPINVNYAPRSGTYTADYFDSTWIPSTTPGDPLYTDPADPAIGWSGNNIIQADNPNNYIGRTSKPMQVLNYEDGDYADLVYRNAMTQTTTNSTAVNWQGQLLNGHLVPTVGWRKDHLETYTYQTNLSNGGRNDDGVAGPIQDLSKQGDTTEENVSWGVVAHVPADWMENVPVLTGLSVYYNYGENGKVETRFNYDGQPLPNPTAESEDYGIVLTALEDKLSVKVGKYETKALNNNLPGGNNLLGNNNYYLYQLEGWGTSNALMYLFGHEGLDPNQNWHWNWAHIDSGWTEATNFPASQSDLVANHPSTIAQMETVEAWIMGMDQDFFTNYDIRVDVPAVQAAYQNYKQTGDIQPLVDEVAGSYAVGGYTTALFSQSGGNINGIYPNGTIDDASEGYEVEINYRPTPNWTIQINAAKTDAYRLQLGQPMQDFIDKQWARMQGPAGDIRLWWGGDNTIRQYYEGNIIAARLFQEESVGMQAPELRPKRISLVTNYSFTDGMLEGVNVGGSYRWQDEQILGYGLKDYGAENPGLDVFKPIYGDTEDAIDLWVGYETKLTDRITWRIQLNLRNVGMDDGLIAISSNPDGSDAIYRIQQGMSWRVTNTFRF